MASSSLSVRLNNGDGTFAPRIDNPTGSGSAYGVIALDLDSDMVPDLASANFYTDEVATWLGAGDGTFGPASLDSVGDQPLYLDGGDLDGDGDLVVANQHPLQESGTVSVLLNQGGGVFAAADSFGLLGATDEPVLGDFDLDGDLDIAVNNDGGGRFDLGDGLTLFFNNGDGSFAPRVEYPVGLQPIWVTGGDINGDLAPDLATANVGSDNVSVVFNNNDGTFSAAFDFMAGEDPDSVVMVDLDGDGDLDLAVANLASNTLTVHINRRIP